MYKRQELDVSLDFPGVERPIEQPELHRAFLEDRVQVQAVVAASVIVLMAAACSVVPDPLHLLHVSWPASV